MTEFAFANLATPAGDRAAIVVDGRHYRLDRLDIGLPGTGLRALMGDWDGLFAKAAAVASHLAGSGKHAAFVVDPVITAPIRFPDKLVCVGAVYSDHLEQMNLPPTRWPKMPIFLRPPTTSIVGPGRTVRIPSMTQQFDWEIELAVIIGRQLSDGNETTALAAIAGYSVGIDFSCRDLLDRGSPAGVDLVRAKAQDTMAPLGPVLAPAAFVGDPQHLSLRLWINGVLRQDGHTRTMLFSVAEQLATISQFITLEPGDVVFTGSPAGSARDDSQFLNPGDHVRAEIERVGRLDLELYRAPMADSIVLAEFV